MRNKGITLITLIITIIVLLILAGVTINMIMGDSGIISKARIAKEKTEEAQKEEENKLEDLEKILNNSREEKIRELSFFDESRNQCHIPEGIRECYVIISHNTNADPFYEMITGDIVIEDESEQVAGQSYVDRYGSASRNTLSIYKVKLNGNEGDINMSVGGGTGSYRAWTAVVAY